MYLILAWRDLNIIWTVDLHIRCRRRFSCNCAKIFILKYNAYTKQLVLENQKDIYIDVLIVYLYKFTWEYLFH